MRSLLFDVLQANGVQEFSSGPLVRVEFASTHSAILINNQAVAYCSLFTGLEGLFRKDIEASLLYGRELCDLVKATFITAGFFTSDELPRYGITRSEIRHLYTQMGKQKRDGNLIILFAYDQHVAERERQFLCEYFQAELDQIASLECT